MTIGKRNSIFKKGRTGTTTLSIQCKVGPTKDYCTAHTDSGRQDGRSFGIVSRVNFDDERQEQVLEAITNRTKEVAGNGSAVSSTFKLFDATKPVNTINFDTFICY